MLKRLTLSVLVLVGFSAPPSQANEIGQSALVGQHLSNPSAFHTSHSGRVVPLVCDPDSNPSVSAGFVNVGGQLTLQLNGGGDPADIVGAFIDGFAGQTLQSVQVEFNGPCLQANPLVEPEGPNIFVIGNDTFGNGVLAVANCTTPLSSATVHNGFTRELFQPNVFLTFVNSGGNFVISPNPLVKIVGMDIEASGLSAPLYVRNILVNNTPAYFDTKAADQVGCLPIPSPF